MKNAMIRILTIGAVLGLLVACNQGEEQRAPTEAEVAAALERQDRENQPQPQPQTVPAQPAEGAPTPDDLLPPEEADYLNTSPPER
ncbi:MAG: hypothetical protein ACK4E3_07245 [Brevundimonas sp.]|uniref:hypothetical protein n=1 Tax=Brevundimonas sp. TaxID=1871086 RepID=UPI00391B9CF2